MRVRLFSNFGDSTILLPLLVRQTPTLRNSRYKTLEFVHDENYEYAVCFNWPIQRLRCSASKTVGFLMEPPELESLDLARLSQIGQYYTPVESHKAQLGKRFCLSVMKMLLHTPILSDNTRVPSKKLLRMSMIVSGKNTTPFQVKRLEIYHKLLKTALPIDFYGRDLVTGSDSRIKGILPSLDKQQGLFPYSMSIALENTNTPECLSEKLYDCLISNCIPITNAPGAQKYLSENSYVFLDFNQPSDRIVEQISKLHQLSSEQLTSYDKPVMSMKSEVLTGRLSLAEGIYQALTTLS